MRSQRLERGFSSGPLAKLLSVLVVLIIPTPTTAQIPVQNITGKPTCRTCAVVRYRIATITDSSFPEGALIRAATVHVNSDRTFFVTAGPSLRELFFANSNGQILRRVGRRGEGPGEYSRPQSIGETPSTYLVFDDALNRVTKLSKNTLKVINTIPFVVTRVSEPVVFPDGSYAVAGDLRTRDGAGYALHRSSPNGQIALSYGKDRLGRGRDTPTALAAARDGGVWAGYYNRYRIEKWDKQGNLVAVYDRHVDWFPARDPRPITTVQKFTNLEGLHEDEQGRLWVHLMVRRRVNAETTVQRGSSPPQQGRVVKLDPSFGESIIEVLDPAARAVVASHRFPNWKATSAGGGFYLQASRASPLGELLYEVWGFRLRQ